MRAADINQTVRCIYAIWLTFLPNCIRIFMTIVFLTCLINYSWELFLVASDWKIQKTQFCFTAWSISTTFGPNNKKILWMHSSGICMTLRYHKKFKKVKSKTVFSGFLCVYLPTSWNLMPSKHTKFLRQESQFENQRSWSQINHFFFILAALFLKLNEELECFTASVISNAKYYWQYMQRS